MECLLLENRVAVCDLIKARVFNVFVGGCNTHEWSVKMLKMEIMGRKVNWDVGNETGSIHRWCC